MRTTKKGNKYNCGSPVGPHRRSYNGFRDMFEDRKQSRMKAEKLKYKLQQKRDDHLFMPEKYQPLTELEEKIYQSLQKMKGRDRWEEKTNEVRRFCIGGTGTVERSRKLMFFMSGKEICHPEDSTFRKRVKILSDKGREYLKRKKRLMKARVQATAQGA